jgi:hypothetical protein
LAHLASGRFVFELPSDRAASPHAGLTAVGLVDAGRTRWKVGAQDVLASDAPTQPRGVEYPRLMGTTYDGLGPVSGLGTFRGQPKLHLRLEVAVEFLRFGCTLGLRLGLHLGFAFEFLSVRALAG